MHRAPAEIAELIPQRKAWGTISHILMKTRRKEEEKNEASGKAYIMDKFFSDGRIVSYIQDFK